MYAPGLSGLGLKDFPDWSMVISKSSAPSVCRPNHCSESTSRSIMESHHSNLTEQLEPMTPSCTYDAVVAAWQEAHTLHQSHAHQTHVLTPHPDSHGLEYFTGVGASQIDPILVNVPKLFCESWQLACAAADALNAFLSHFLTWQMEDYLKNTLGAQSASFTSTSSAMPQIIPGSRMSLPSSIAPPASFQMQPSIQYMQIQPGGDAGMLTNLPGLQSSGSPPLRCIARVALNPLWDLQACCNCMSRKIHDQMGAQVFSTRPRHLNPGCDGQMSFMTNLWMLWNA